MLSATVKKGDLPFIFLLADFSVFDAFCRDGFFDLEKGGLLFGGKDGVEDVVFFAVRGTELGYAFFQVYYAEYAVFGQGFYVFESGNGVVPFSVGAELYREIDFALKSFIVAFEYSDKRRGDENYYAHDDSYRSRNAGKAEYITRK